MKPIHNITFSFDDAEDRITLRCKLNDKTLIALQLTRRLTGPLLEKLAKLLLKSSDVAAALPAQLQEEVSRDRSTPAPLAQVAAQVRQSDIPGNHAGKPRSSNRPATCSRASTSSRKEAPAPCNFSATAAMPLSPPSPSAARNCIGSSIPWIVSRNAPTGKSGRSSVAGWYSKMRKRQISAA